MGRRVLDFRIRWLPHSEVKKAEQDQVRKLINKIESHPDQGDLQEDLKHTNVFDPCCENSSKTLIRETGNVEYFVLYETDSRVQCPCCLSCWVKGIVNCNWGICLSHTDEVRRTNMRRFDTLSIVGHVIKKGVGHGARHGKSEEQLFYHKSLNAWKRWGRHKGESSEYFAGILDRFQRDPVYRESQEVHGWTEGLCKEIDEKVQENHTYKLTREELARHKSNWNIALNSSGSNAPLASRPDYRAAVALKNHLYRNSEDYKAPVAPQDQDGVRERDKFSGTYRQRPRVDKKIGWKYLPSSSFSSTWWQSDQLGLERSLLTNMTKANITRLPGAEHVPWWNPTGG